MSLIHLVYTSEATEDFSEPAVVELLKHVRPKNMGSDISGILLLIDRSFFQILEGEASTLDALFAKIKADARHRHVVKLIQEPIARREFKDWSMGLARVTSKELANLPGFSDFARTGHGLESLGPGLARKLLGAFREGQWRSRLDK